MTTATLKRSQKTPLTAILDGVKVPSKNESVENKCSSFVDWSKFLDQSMTPDKARSVLYFGLQPLFDKLVDNSFDGEGRTKALEAFDKLAEDGVAYLTDYYTGKADPDQFSTRAKKIVTLLPESGYSTKFRNIDRYEGDCRPSHVLQFLQQFVRHVADKKIKKPQVVVACACGAAEVAMPLAGLFGAKLLFVRFSKRRSDEKAFMLSEHVERLSLVRNKNVVCVEDYVCSGRSLGMVMEFVKKGEPKGLYGASPWSSSESKTKVHTTIDESNFNVFELGKGAE